MALRACVTAVHRPIRPLLARHPRGLRGAFLAMQQDVSRRSFLGTCSAAGAAVAVNEASLGSAPPVAAAPSWVDRPMRWAQLTLVEDDPGKFDLAFWLDYFRRTHSDAACLSAGGCVAYYPTEIPLHHRSRWLGDRDPFGDLVAGCRKLGMVVVARTDPHATYDDVQRGASRLDRRRRRGPPAPPLGLAGDVGHLRPGPVQLRVHDRACTKEIMTRYRVDGIFINRWAGSGMCYCEHCRDEFPGRDRASICRAPTTRRIRRAGRTSSGSSSGSSSCGGSGTPRSARSTPTACVIPNAGGGATSALDMKTIGELAPTLFADRQARSGLMPPWANGKNAKEYRATMGSKPIGGHLQRGRGGGIPLEGLGAERGGDPHLGRRRDRQRPAALVHQVLRHAPRPALARRRRGPLPLASPRRDATCATRLRWPGSAWSTRSRPPGSTAARGPGRRSKTTRWAGTRR